MVTFDCLVADCPWAFSDKLTMSDVKRGAEANYNTMSTAELCALPVKNICADDSILVSWVPGSLIQDGMDVMKAWGFEQKQTWIWVKIKKNPLELLKKQVINTFKNDSKEKIFYNILNFNINEILSFGMGRYFRQCHELALVGVRGKMASKVLDKSQRSVFFDVVKKHSAKPEGLQDKLDLMFPSKDFKKLELFARRERANWLCVGNESPASYGQNIKESINILENITYVPKNTLIKC